MSFLLLSDYLVQIKPDLLKVLTEGSDLTRIDAEQAATDEMQGYLRGRFDLGACFPEVQVYSLTEQYDAGTIVLVPGTPGSAGAPGSAGTPATPALLYVANRDTLPGELPSPATAGKMPAPLAPGAAGPPLPVPAWRVSDPRAKLLKMYLVDMTLYHLHSRQNPQTVPQIRQDRYDTALQWCKDCRTGKVSPGLPLLADRAPDGTPHIESIRARGGSLPKLSNSY
jgi:phage gp36-like protein